MAAKRPKIEVFKSGDWYWHLRARNGEIMCQSEGYRRKSGAINAAEKFKINVAQAVIEVDE